MPKPRAKEGGAACPEVSTGVQVSIAQEEGARVSIAQEEGARVSSAQEEGARVSSAQEEGARVSIAQEEGARVSSDRGIAAPVSSDRGKAIPVSSDRGKVMGNLMTRYRGSQEKISLANGLTPLLLFAWQWNRRSQLSFHPIWKSPLVPAAPPRRGKSSAPCLLTAERLYCKDWPTVSDSLVLPPFKSSMNLCLLNLSLLHACNQVPRLPTQHNLPFHQKILYQENDWSCEAQISERQGYGNSSWFRQERDIPHALRSHICRTGLPPLLRLLLLLLQLPSPAHLGVQVQQQLRDLGRHLTSISGCIHQGHQYHEETFANIKSFLQPLVDSMSIINTRLDALEKRPAAAAAPPVSSTFKHSPASGG
ncbi:UNVERIFIED_CONTAM: hypothetical protein FKN15_032096 [Acipenser sinensis]